MKLLCGQYGGAAHRCRENHGGEEADVAEVPQGMQVLREAGGEHHSQGREKNLETIKRKIKREK